MRSSNANFDEDGFGNVIRDIEELNLNMSDLGEDAEGQSKNLSVIQNSVGALSTNVQSLANRLTTDEAAIASLQSSVAGISTHMGSADCAIYSGTINFASSGRTVDQTAIGTSLVTGTLTGYDTGTGVFTAPYDGIYAVTVIVVTGGTATSGAYGRMRVSGTGFNIAGWGAYLPIVQLSDTPTTGTFVSQPITAGSTFSVTLSGVFGVNQTDTFFIGIYRL